MGVPYLREGLSAEETAEILGITKKEVELIEKRALQKLRDHALTRKSAAINLAREHWRTRNF